MSGNGVDHGFEEIHRVPALGRSGHGTGLVCAHVGDLHFGRRRHGALRVENGPRDSTAIGLGGCPERRS